MKDELEALTKEREELEAESKQIKKVELEKQRIAKAQEELREHHKKNSPFFKTLKYIKKNFF